MYRLHLTYDVVGRIPQREETVSGTAHTFSYAYDPDGRLTGVSGAAAEAYAYDLNGNRITANGTPASYDAQDRILSRGGVSYTFDADGFMTGRGADTFQYSARGELLQATVGGELVQYAYDGFGRRVGRTVAGDTYQYFYGNLRNVFQVTEARDPSGVLSHYYYDESDLLFAVRRAGTWYYVATDQVGTPVAVSDAAGVVVKALTHDSFGNLLTDSNPAFDLPIGFAGGLANPLTGLLRFGMRDYDSAAGRWTARDPVSFQGAVGNLYVAVNNNPVNLRDPSGLFSFGGSVYAGIGGGWRFTYTPQGTQVCFEVGVGVGASVEIDPNGQLDHDGAYVKGELEAGIGPLGAKVGGRLLDCGEAEGDLDCNYGPLTCSRKLKPKPDFKGVKASAKLAANFCMTMNY